MQTRLLTLDRCIGWRRWRVGSATATMCSSRQLLLLERLQGKRPTNHFLTDGSRDTPYMVSTTGYNTLDTVLQAPNRQRSRHRLYDFALIASNLIPVLASTCTGAPQSMHVSSSAMFMPAHSGRAA